MSSSAAAVNADTIINGKAVNVTNQVFASGATVAAYNQRTAPASFVKAMPLGGGMTLTVNAKAPVSTAWAPATAGGSRVAHSTATIGTLTERLNDTQGTILTITGTSLSSGANFTKNTKGIGTANSTMSSATFTINAPTWGIKNLVHHGTAAPNTVLFKNAKGTLIVYAHYQVVTTAFGTMTSIMADAIDIHMKQFVAGGKTMTGDIQIGTTIAK